jgi:cytochrome bd-type quinol oxidase subunit 2
MLSIILVLVLLYQVYKAANENGRNGILWAVIAFIGSILLQLMIGIAYGIVIGLGIEFWGWSPDLLQTFSWPISIATMVINVAAIWLLIKYLSRVQYTDPFQPPPPPPPANFN